MFKGNIIKKCISLVMVIAVLVGLSAPASAAVAEILTDDKYNDYIALGDAITVGKGLDGDDKRYYELLAEDLFKAGLIEKDSYFSYSGTRWRVEELRALLDDEYYDSDAYWDDGYSTSLKGRVAAQNAVANAKYVSVQIGMNNFATYFVKQIMLYLEGKETYAYDFSNFADEDVINAMEQVRGAVMEQLTTVAPSEEAELALDFINFAVEVAAYALLSYITNFNGLVEAIYDLNPDVKLYVIGLNNPAAGETLTLTIAGETRSVPIGDAIGAVVEMANAYAQILAPRLPNKDSYTYVDPGDTNRLIDKMADYSLSVYDRIPAALRGELLWYSDTEEDVVVSIQELFWEYGVEKSYEEALAIAEEIVFAATEELRDEYIINSINYLVIEAVLVEFQNKLAKFGQEYTENFTLTKGQIEELLNNLENPPAGKTREEVATEFVEDMMAEAMVGQTIDGMYIETKEDAKNAIKLLESFSGEDTEAKKEYATKIIMQKVNENGLGEYIEESDVRDLLDRMEVSSSKETVVNWMNDVAARKINEKVQALLNTTEDKTTAVKAMLADMEKPGADANAVAKTHLMNMGFRAMIAEKIAEKYTENGLKLATFTSFEAFADAIVTAKTTAEAKALIRKEVVAAALASDEVKSYLGTAAPTTNEVLAWFAEADKKQTEAEQKAVIKAFLNKKYGSLGTTLDNMLLDKFYGAYTAAVTAETTFVDYTAALNESIGSFSNYLELKGEAANQIYAAYEQYYKGQGANAQEYYKIYKSLKDAATDEVMKGFEKYQSAIDTCKGKCDALCAKFDKMFEMLASVAELDSLCLNDLLDVAAEAAINPVDYIDQVLDSLKEGTGLTTGQMTLAYLALCYYIGDGMMHMPSSEGHKAMASQLFKAINGGDTSSTLGGLANAVINKLIDIYHMPTSASGQAAPLVNPNQYVAFGDNITSGNGTAVSNADQIYVQLLADALAMHKCADEHCDHDEVLNLSLDGMRTEELLAIVDRTYNYTGDAYTDARFDIEALREKYQALYADQDLDLVTINVGINNLVTYPITQTMLAYNNETTYALDWGHYIGDGRAAKLEKGKTAMMDLLMGIVHDDSTCETTLRTVAVGIESMLYGLIGFVANLDLSVEEIHKAFPNAVIVLTQLYNPLQGTYFTTPDSIEFKNIRTGNKVTVSELKQFTIDIGDIADGMINVANRFLTRYIGCYGSDEVASVPGSNIVTVSINNTPLDIDPNVSKDLADMEHVVTINVLGTDRKIYVPEYLVESVRTGGVALHPNAEGHQYICDQILKMLKYEINANIIVDDASKYYGEADPTFKYYIDDLSRLYGIKIKSIVPAYPAGMTATTAVPGYYDLIVTYTAEDGYNSVSVSMSDLAKCLNTERKDNLNPQLWIKKMPVTVTVMPEKTNITVGGDIPKYYAVVTDIYGNVINGLDVELSGVPTDNQIAGNFTISAKLDNPNYVVETVNNAVLTIDKKPVKAVKLEVVLSKNFIEYGDELPDVNVIVTDEDGKIVTGLDVVVSNMPADSTHVGDHTITADLAEGVEGYFVSSVNNATLTINRKPVIVTVTPDSHEIYQNGQLPGFTVTVTDEDGNVITDGFTANVDLSQVNTAVLGTYDVTVDFTSDVYEATVINGATVTVKFDFSGASITSHQITLNLDGQVFMRYGINLIGFPEDFDFANKGGVIVWTGSKAPTSRQQMYVGAENCVTKPSSMTWSDVFERWQVTSLGINAKNYGDEVYMRAYVEVAPGEYIYGPAGHSSPEKYCKEMLGRPDVVTNVKETCASLLNYGAAAQMLFDYKLDKLVTNGVDLTKYNLGFTQSMIDPIDRPTKEMADTLTGIRSGVGSATATLSLQDAIVVKTVYPVSIPAEEIERVELLVWTEEAYNNADTLAYDAETYSYVVEMKAGSLVGVTGYVAELNAIPIKAIGDTLYFSCRVIKTNGEVHRSGLGFYNPDKYINDMQNNDDPEVAAVVKAMAVYSQKARILFSYKLGELN